MYKNIGKKIKILAKVLAIVLSVITVTMGVYMIIKYNDPIVADAVGYIYNASYKATVIIVAVIVVILAVALNWVSSWILYGFGELIDNTTAIKKQTKQQVTKFEEDTIQNTTEQL